MPPSIATRSVVTIVSDETIKEQDQEYLKDKQIADLMQGLLNKVITEKPKDPIQFLLVSHVVAGYRGLFDGSFNVKFDLFVHPRPLPSQTELEKQRVEVIEMEKQKAALKTADALAETSSD